MSKRVFDLAFLALRYFKSMDSGQKLIDTQKTSASAVSETLARMFCSTIPCKSFVDEKIPICHRQALVPKFVKYLFESVCRRKLSLLNDALPKETVHAGKTALMRTNPLVQNNSGKEKFIYLYGCSKTYLTTATSTKRKNTCPGTQQQRKKRRVMPSVIFA